MAEEDPVLTAIRHLVSSLSGLELKDVRPSNRNRPTSGDFATVLVMSTEQVGHDDIRYEAVPDDDDSVTEEVAGQRMVTASLQFFREGALTKANRFRDRLSLPSSVQLLQQLGLGLISADPVRNLTALINTENEPRYQLNVYFYVVASENTVVPTFGTFPITGTVDGVTTTQEVHEP